MDRQAATEGRAPFTDNRRILEFLILAGILGIGTPCAVLMGVKSGERTAAILYPDKHDAAAWYPGKAD
ncbi:MAG: hypothetical protein ABIW76_10205 [Fibrobacteria bacterium]